MSKSNSPTLAEMGVESEPVKYNWFELLAALKDITGRFNLACVHSGSDQIYADIACQKFNELIAKCEVEK